MKTTVDLPDALYRQVKALAVLRGTSVRELMIAALERELRVGLQATAVSSSAEVESYRQARDTLEALARQFTESLAPGSSPLQELLKARHGGSD